MLNNSPNDNRVILKTQFIIFKFWYSSKMSHNYCMKVSILSSVYCVVVSRFRLVNVFHCFNTVLCIKNGCTLTLPYQLPDYSNPACFSWETIANLNNIIIYTNWCWFAIICAIPRFIIYAPTSIN